jgi:opacity protein-like surface antigen
VVSRIAVSVVFFVLLATGAEAQPEVFSGLLTGHLGPAAGGDVRDWTLMPGAAMAVLDESGLGLEIDASHAGDFDDTQFSDSSITTVTLGVLALYPHERFRPFVIGGAGVVRTRAVVLPELASTTQTDTVWHAGGGLLYMVNEAFGVRGDIRYFRQFGRQQVLPLGANETLDFIRISVGVSYSWPMR